MSAPEEKMGLSGKACIILNLAAITLASFSIAKSLYGYFQPPEIVFVPVPVVMSPPSLPYSGFGPLEAKPARSIQSLLRQRSSNAAFGIDG